MPNSNILNIETNICMADCELIRKRSMPDSVQVKYGQLWTIIDSYGQLWMLIHPLKLEHGGYGCPTYQQEKKTGENRELW